jgi:hypothetical protein
METRRPRSPGAFDRSPTELAASGALKSRRPEVGVILLLVRGYWSAHSDKFLGNGAIAAGIIHRGASGEIV